MGTGGSAKAGTGRAKLTRGLAVIQPLPGIGDMVWHVPHIRALATHFGQPVTLIAKPRSAAAEIFAAEETVADVLWLERNPARGSGDSVVW